MGQYGVGTVIEIGSIRGGDGGGAVRGGDGDRDRVD